MTRKDFNLIAGALKASKPTTYTSGAAILRTDAFAAQWRLTCSNVADALSTTNTQFDYVRFLTACGVEWDDPAKS